MGKVFLSYRDTFPYRVRDTLPYRVLYNFSASGIDEILRPSGRESLYRNGHIQLHLIGQRNWHPVGSHRVLLRPIFSRSGIPLGEERKRPLIGSRNWIVIG